MTVWKNERYGVDIIEDKTRCGLCAQFPGDKTGQGHGECKEAKGRHVYAMDYRCSKFKKRGEVIDSTGNGNGR